MRRRRQAERSATLFKASYVGRGRHIAWKVLDRHGREAGSGTAPTLDQAKAATEKFIAELKAGQAGPPGPKE